MDFARKQLEKFGWKEGNGLGKDNQGIAAAIKPTLKVGKEGMGYDLSKELVDTWWTRAYDDSLKRIDIQEGENETLGVTLKEDDGSNDKEKADEVTERPFFKMRKRMMKASFPSFSKGATLSNGEMITNDSSSDESESEADSGKKEKGPKVLTDEELLKACGGRTAHKGARFGLKLTGKLARIAAQEEAAKRLLSSPNPKSSPGRKIPESGVQDVVVPSESKSEKKSKKKKKSKDKDQENNTKVQTETEASEEGCETNSIAPQENEEIPKKSKKSKKHKKRKYEALLDESDADISTVCETVETGKPTTGSNPESESASQDKDNTSVKSKKKSKKHKKSKHEGDFESLL